MASQTEDEKAKGDKPTPAESKAAPLGKVLLRLVVLLVLVFAGVAVYQGATVHKINLGPVNIELGDPATASQSATSPPPPTTSLGDANQSAPSTNTAERAPSGPVTEIAQYPATIFRNREMGAVVGHTEVGKHYVVACRIAPSPDQPSSLSGGGWYVIADDGGYVAANTFANGPLPNDNAFDSHVEVCS